MALNPKATRNNGHRRPIRLTIPISVACDLEKLQKALANVTRLIAAGHTHPNLSFLASREFVVDPASLQAREPAAEL